MPTGSLPLRSSAECTAPSLEVEGVSFSYPARLENGVLYKDFSLRVAPGSIVAIMGASGSGKSTLAKIMARIITPQKGTVKWAERFKNAADVVYIDQHPMNSVFPWQTVRSNLQYPLRKLGWEQGARRERLCYLITLFRLGGLLDAYPAQLSGGELQRLALARCLSWRPELVILDEPFSALDRKVKEEISSRLHELAMKDRITLVLITHNISDALALATRCIVIAQHPVQIISDLDFRSGFPREEGAPDYDAMQQALISSIRDGLV
jgi:ABC-type nitrate/sulfonate/bicarbonate transport system ATPase subunit